MIYDAKGKESEFEVEITPAMIKAGVEVFEDWEMRDDWSIERLVSDLYRRMKSQQQDQLRKS